MKRWGALLFIAVLVFAFDFLTKFYTYHILPEISMSSPIYPYGGIPVFYDWHGIHFSINHAQNKGAAWSLFSSYQNILLYIRIAIAGGICTYLLCVKNTFFRRLAFSLILAGAIGNICDYFLYGCVIDLFYFVFWGYSYPIFNVADSAVFCGAACLFLQSFFRKRKVADTSSV
jgi:signal peptidase II